MVILILCGATRVLQAQGWPEILPLARDAEEKRDFKHARELYERGYRLSGFDPTALVLAASAAMEGGDGRSGLRLLDRALRDGFFQPGFLEYAIRDSSFAAARRQARWPEFVRRTRARYAAIDTTLRSELLRLAEQDQRNRVGIDTVVTHFGRQSPQADSVFASLERADAPLRQRVADIVAARGWPVRHLVGDDGAHAAWLVVQHAPLGLQQRMLPLVRAAVGRGDARPGDLALLEDRVLVGEGKPQRYGSQMNYSPTGGPGTVAPIEDPDCVDQRRAKVGLEPLSAYLMQFGIDYTPPPRAPSRSSRRAPACTSDARSK